MIDHRVYNKSSTKGATCGAGIAYPYETHEFTTVFSGVNIAGSSVFYVMFCKYIVIFWPLCCMSFFAFRLLISPLVSACFVHANKILCFSFVPVSELVSSSDWEKVLPSMPFRDTNLSLQLQLSCYCHIYILWSHYGVTVPMLLRKILNPNKAKGLKRIVKSG